MTTFVLIPGAGSDPRVYEATIEELRERGHDGVAPPLPLEDQEPGPSDHAEAIVDAVPASDDIAVVAHSLGAFAGPLAAERLEATSLILLAPMIPAPGETAGEWWESTGHAEALADTIERFGPMSQWEQDALDYVFLHDVDPVVARESERYSGRPTTGMFTEPWPLEQWPAIPTRVLAPREDRLFPQDFQGRIARERLEIELDYIDGGHLPMLSRPGELAQRLIEIAAITRHDKWL